MATETTGFWLFEGLEEEPYGLLPLVNLSAKGTATSTKKVERIGSYQWNLEEDEPVIIIPGLPPESFYWPGGRLSQDHGVLVYDINHLKVKDGTLDPLILAARHLGVQRKKEINFDEYDFITDSVNLQKLFAFAQEAGEGKTFRIDCERVGKTVLLSRMEASDLMEIGHVTFDQALKAKMTKPRSKHCAGPFFQLVSYQFAMKLGPYEDVPQLPAKKPFEENANINFVDFGDLSKHLTVKNISGAGFPFFTWAQLFFTCADQEIVGFFKGNGDFGKPAMHSLPDVSKLMKPLPYVVLSKVHDCLNKIRLFLMRNDPTFRFGLIWKGKAHLEIFAKHLDSEGAVSPKVREFLQTQCKEVEENDLGHSDQNPSVPAEAVAQ
uniref:Uncharacterized protein n=1 Tax=Ditylenchus dipsaci TaxID=166011 RepID=A0A915CSM0_9BILA